jgi:hypothetical protein
MASTRVVFSIEFVKLLTKRIQLLNQEKTTRFLCCAERF